MFTTNNNFKVFVSNVDTVLAYSSATSPGVDLSGLTAGQIALLNGSDQMLNTASVTVPEAMKIAMRDSNGNLTFSDTFKAKNIVGLSSQAYTAPVEQVTYIGSNGTSGAIQALDYNEYILSLIYKHDDLMWSEQINVKPYLVTTEGGAVASTIATAFASLINGDSYSKVKAEVVSDVTTVATSGGAFTVNNGSNVITTVESSGAAGDAAKYNSDGSTLVVGDYIRLGHATTKTYPIYRIAAITGAGTAAATITLDRNYAGTTGSVAAASAGAVASATGVAANFGLQLTGLVLTWIAKGIFPYKQVAFNVTTKGFGSTTQATTAATYPQGYYQQINDLEWFSQFGSDGIRNAMTIPIPTGRTETLSTKTYKVYTIKYKGTSENDPIIGMSNMTATIYICIADDATTVTGYWDTILGSLATAAGVTAL